VCYLGLAQSFKGKRLVKCNQDYTMTMFVTSARRAPRMDGSIQRAFSAERFMQAQDRGSMPAKHVQKSHMSNQNNFRRQQMLLEQKQDRKMDQTIPMRRQRVERLEAQVNQELIRLALQAPSASEAAQEEA
jgi:hypothetical protein